MGKYTLLIVLAAILGGSMLTLNMRLTSGLTGKNRAEGQASVLARQIAESGQGVALATAVGDNGFLDDASFFASFGTDARSYNGGFYQADSFRSYNGGRRADLVVSGVYGESGDPSRHVLASTYEFDPMDYPGPVWLDVPYATASGSASTSVDGMANVAGVNVALNAHFDRKKYDDMNGLLPFATMETQLQTAIAGAGIQFSSPMKAVNKPAALGAGKILDDLNVDNAEDLYQTAIGAMGATDRTFAPAVPGGTYTVTSAETWDGPSAITHVNGSLTVAPSGRIDGEGVLAVSGNLLVQTGGRLDWDGLVIVRSDADSMAVEILGTTTIEGGLVVNQEAFPQVGHMDMTVLKSPTGDWNTNWGIFGPTDGNTRPWYEHTHKFDDDPSVLISEKQRMARFVHDGDAALNQDAKLIFQQTLDGLGSDEVQIRFKNAGAHGHAQYTLRLDGEAPVTGPVRVGFPSTFSQGNAFQSRSFPADELEAFTVDVRSLPALKRLWDTEPGCSQPTWPRCVGIDRQREGALTIQIVHNSVTIYEAAMYWHVRTDEWADHLAKIAAWRAKVLATNSFGLKLDLSQADISVDLPNIVRLSDRLGFDGNRVNLLNTSVRHISAKEFRSQSAPTDSASVVATTAVPPDGSPVPSTAPSVSGKVWVCHRAPGTGAFGSVHVNPNAVPVHSSHTGDYMGPCN